MKYQNILGWVAAACMFLTGCSTDNDTSSTWGSDPNAVHVSASVGSIFTRSNPAATNAATQKNFNDGDVMGVSNNGKSLNYTFKGNDWQPDNNTDYLVWDNSQLTFQCWYPADGTNSYSKGYVLEDQSSAEQIAKSDYMVAEKTLDAIPTNRNLEVALTRKTARLIFNIQSFNDQFAADTKVNHIRIVSKASTDASDESSVNIKPLQKEGDAGVGGVGTTYTALVMPGDIEAKLYFGADETAETPLVVKTGDLKAGNSYTYQLTVGKNKVSVADITVKDWNEGDITGGKAEIYAPYVTFTAEEAQTFKMTALNGYNISGLEYSVNNGGWQKVEADQEVSFGGNNGTLRLRGKNSKGTAKDIFYNSTITFTNANVKVACKGDIRTLLDWENYEAVVTNNARFCNLFKGCEALTSAPELPATTLAEGCYRNMFNGCTNLNKAPELPAEELAKECYSYMFYGCTSIKTAPVLPATRLAESCYKKMFYGCTNLTSVTMLAPSKQIGGVYFDDWLKNAGTDANVKSRTLKIEDADVYGALATWNSDNWKKGQCTVVDKNGKEI